MVTRQKAANAVSRGHLGFKSGLREAPFWRLHSRWTSCMFSFFFAGPLWAIGILWSTWKQVTLIFQGLNLIPMAKMTTKKGCKKGAKKV